MKRPGRANFFIFLGIAAAFFCLWYINTYITGGKLALTGSKEVYQKNRTYQYKIHDDLPKNIIEIINGVSYKENSPVSLEDLAYIQLMYWGFDNVPHWGELIVNKKVAGEVAAIFKDIYEAKFPIEKMRLIDYYQADDYLSMADNNSSAFCVRKSWGSDLLSIHSYGLAIDINPVQNPYIKGDIVLPAGGGNHRNRSKVSKGMIVPGNAVYDAFKKRGWSWGGQWKNLKDYQHFEKKIRPVFISDFEQ